MSLYYFAAARSEEQLADMKQLDARGICIFCPEHITEDASPLQYESDYWMIKNNSFPYKNTKLHLLLIPKQHVTTLTALSEEAQADYFSTIAWVEKEYKLDTYAIVTRSGDMRGNGGSIEHIHTHLIVGDVDNPNHEVVRVKVSSPRV